MLFDGHVTMAVYSSPDGPFAAAIVAEASSVSASASSSASATACATSASAAACSGTSAIVHLLPGVLPVLLVLMLLLLVLPLLVLKFQRYTVWVGNAAIKWICLGCGNQPKQCNV
eukprot:scpid105593/ scgid35283/ 